MLRLCSRALVGKVKPYQLLKPVSGTAVTRRNLVQQSELPRLPVPPLRQTCELYLRILEPAVEPEVLQRTRELVEEFQRAGGVGERLQRGLEQRARNTENWVTDDYVKTVFLDLRNPLSIFSNPAIIFPPVAYRDTDMGQIRVAAKAIAGMLDVKAMIDNGTLPVDYMGGKPLCMKQCEQLMSTCRVPGPKSDSLVFYSKSSNPPKHITVVHNCQFFKMEAYNGDGSRLTVDQLCVQLERICSSSQQTSTEPVGILTTQDRDVWRKIYFNLIKDETSKESVSAIQSSIFTVCLDGAMPPVSHVKIHQILHGGGSQWNSGNRWFDKSLQIIVGEDGTCGANHSHAAADGSASASVFDLALEMMKKPEMMQSPSEPLPTPQRLHFNITPEIKKDIEEAKQHMDTLVQNLDQSDGVFDHFGKDDIKAHKMSPDAFVQLAIQLAYYRIHHQCCPTLEAVSLRMFRLGRLATINSNTSTSVAFVKALDDPETQDLEKVDLMKSATEAHRRYMMMGRSGQCLRLHLLMLRRQAVEEEVSMPDIFTDTSFANVFDFKMVTSQVLYKTGCRSLMGPEEPDAYSVCYSINNDYMYFTVCYFDASKTYRENKPAAIFLQALQDALQDMRSLLEERPRAQMEKSQLKL